MRTLGVHSYAESLRSKYTTHIKRIVSNLFTTLHEVASIVDNNVNGTPITFNFLDGLADSVFVGYINSFVCPMQMRWMDRCGDMNSMS